MTWLIYKTGGGGNTTGRVMVRNSLKDSFVSQVRHPFTSFNPLFYLLFLTLLFFSSLLDTLMFPSLAEVINLNHGNEIFALAQPGSSSSGLSRVVSCLHESPGGLLPQETKVG